MPRHALRSELAVKLADGWTGPAGRHALSAETPASGATGRHALAAEVDAIVTGPAITTPTFHGFANNRGFATTNVIGAITGTAPGDILVAFAGGNDQTASLTPPAGEGWTQIADTAGAAAGRLRAFATTATLVNQAGGTWTWSGSHNHYMTILAYDGAALPTTGGTARADGQPTITAPSRTSVGANAMLLTFAYYTSNGSAPAWPGSMTVRSPSVNAAASGVAAEEALPVAGASGTRVFTAGGSPGFFTAVSLILEAAA